MTTQESNKFQKIDLRNEEVERLSEEVRLSDGWMDMVYNNENDQLFKELNEHFLFTEEQFKDLVEDLVWEKLHQYDEETD